MGDMRGYGGGIKRGSYCKGCICVGRKRALLFYSFSEDLWFYFRICQKKSDFKMFLQCCHTNGSLGLEMVDMEGIKGNLEPPPSFSDKYISNSI